MLSGEQYSYLADPERFGSRRKARRRGVQEGGCIDGILETWDENPVEWCFCGVSVVGVFLMVLLVLFMKADIPNCWLPQSPATFPTVKYSISNETIKRVQNKCVPRILRVLRSPPGSGPADDEDEDLAFYEWLSLRSAILWFDPDKVFVHSRNPISRSSLPSPRSPRNRSSFVQISTVVSTNPERDLFHAIAAEGGITWDLRSFAVMPIDRLLCTAFDALVSHDTKDEGDLGYVAVLSKPGSPFAIDLSREVNESSSKEDWPPSGGA